MYTDQCIHLAKRQRTDSTKESIIASWSRAGALSTRKGSVLATSSSLAVPMASSVLPTSSSMGFLPVAPQAALSTRNTCSCSRRKHTDEEMT
mmetsp:Transcript_19777/g.32418  ORF Transcript_19777/g.32418 Transcript_19777/m.32418 type:complete len:92 (-) Transcript_19777:301-576(-)